MNKVVLIVDDDGSVREMIARFLVRRGYSYVEADNGEDAIKIIKSKRQKLHLVLLDIIMPRCDGWYVLERIREISNVPVIMLTAMSDDNDQIKGLNAGADDYICKPFSPGVLMAKIDKILAADEDLPAGIVLGDIVISDSAREVTAGGEQLNLTPKEYELLKYMVTHKGIALSRERILNAVWRYDYVGDLRTVDTHIKQLRSKLKGCSGCIVTVRSIGYKMADIPG